MLFEMLFAIFMIVLLVFLIFRFIPSKLLHYRKRLNPLMVDKGLIKEKGVSHLSNFGAAKAFDQFDIDFSSPTEPILRVKIKPNIPKLVVEFLYFNEKGIYDHVIPYQIIGSEETTIVLPKNTYHVIPVVTLINTEVFEWNIYLLSKPAFLLFALLQSFAIGLIVHYLIQFIYFFYLTFSATCPLCHFGHQTILQGLNWLIGFLSFVVIMTFGKAPFKPFLYGGFIDDSHR